MPPKKFYLFFLFYQFWWSPAGLHGKPKYSNVR